jgi:hypothetical protein
VHYRGVTNDTDTAGDWETGSLSVGSPNAGQSGSFRTTIDWTMKIDDGFESGSLPAGWSGDSSTAVTSETARTGTYSVSHGETAGSVESPTVNTSTANSVVVEFWVRRGGDSFSEDPDFDEDLVVEYRADDGSWVEIERYLGEGTPGERYDELLTLPADAVHDDFALRFRQTGGSGSGFDYWHVDDVVVRTLGENASSPTPMLSPAIPSATSTQENRVDLARSTGLTSSADPAWISVAVRSRAHVLDDA